MGGFSHESDLPQSEIVNVYRTTGLTLACIGLLFGMFYRPKTESGTLKLRTAMSALISSVIVFITILQPTLFLRLEIGLAGTRVLLGCFYHLVTYPTSLEDRLLGAFWVSFLAHLWHIYGATDAQIRTQSRLCRCGKQRLIKSAYARQSLCDSQLANV